MSLCPSVGLRERMVDLQDRRYYAQCTQQLSSHALTALLDLLLTKFPNEIVERKGGDSYHIDFGTLSEEAFSTAKNFVRAWFKDDEDEADDIVQEELSRQDSLTSLQNILDARATSNGLLGNVLELENFVLGKEAVASSPLLLSGTRSIKNPPKTPKEVNSVLYSSVEPDKSPTRRSLRKRVRKSESSGDDLSIGSSKSSPITATGGTGSSRYYNGGRVHRHESENQAFTFHGIPVVLLGQHVITNRPWKCSVCEKAFVSKDKIINHIQLHSGEKTHQCPICHERYSSRHYLKEHQRRVHMFDCQQCKEEFTSFESLHEHTLKEHPQVGEGLCGCMKGCDNARCSCFKNGQLCSSRCHCKDCHNSKGAAE